MPAAHFFAENLEEVGLDPEKVQALFDRAEREVKEGLLPASQVAIARNGKIGAMQTFGRAVQGRCRKTGHQRYPFCHHVFDQGADRSLSLDHDAGGRSQP